MIGDAARRYQCCQTPHPADINRSLRKTNFADSTYQIKAEPAGRRAGQFYELLTAPELDSKNTGSHMTEGQLLVSGVMNFTGIREQKLQLLTDKFMPVREEDGRVREQRLVGYGGVC